MNYKQQSMFDLPLTIHKKENNDESQKWLNENKVRLSNQCQKVWNILQTGKRLTAREAMIEHNIGCLSRRVLDLREQGFEIENVRLEGGYKEYFCKLDA